MTRTALRLAAVLIFALGTGACSTLDLAYDDVLGSGDKPAADANGFPPDQPPGQTSDAAAPTTPDLAGIPDKPSGTTNPDAQKDVADSLATDRARANYSADALRGGTEAAAPPPGPNEGNVAVADASGLPPETPAQPAPAAPPPPAGTEPPPAAPADSVAPVPAPSTAVAAAPMPAPGSTPAVPAVGSSTVASAGPMSDAQLGFKPSTAPALDSSVSNFVAQPIINRYQQTASAAGIATARMPPSAVASAAPPLKRGRGGKAMGGPEAMGGSVIANLDVLSAPSATPSVYANPAGLPPAAVVMFPGDTTRLDAAAREQIRLAVSAFQQRGGAGFLKVIGHSSSRTGNMPVEKHLMTIFEKSQARAKAVAAEIIREGVPASRVLIEAVGDSQPVYYESMPQGEEGNRRAEIFIQG
jgi:outer membrane protein OmpA-like peptidoglycan-associated protein